MFILLSVSGSNDSDLTLKNCLFGAVTLTKNADLEKYGYSGYGIGFDTRGSFSLLLLYILKKMLIEFIFRI